MQTLGVCMKIYPHTRCYYFTYGFPYFYFPAFSIPAFSTLSGFVPHFPFLHFPALYFCATFSSLAFSTPCKSLQVCAAFSSPAFSCLAFSASPRRSLKTFLFGQWGHGAGRATLIAPPRNNLSLTLVLSKVSVLPSVQIPG